MSKLPKIEVSVERFNSQEYLIRDQKPIGGAVIINIDEWQKKHEQYFPKRTGSKTDVKNLKEALNHIGISKIEIKNESKKVIETRLGEIARDPEYTTKADVFICIIMSYGGNGYFYDYEEQKVYLSDIMKIFNGVSCPGLVLKPKIFIMQACDKSDAIEDDKALFSGKKKPGDEVTHPQEADFLTYTSTVSGKFTWGPKTGTYFIDCICWFLKEQKEVDFIKLTIAVNSAMDKYLEEFKSKQRLKRDFELPLCTSQFTKKLLLKKKPEKLLESGDSPRKNE